MAPAHGVATGAMQGGVDAAHGGGGEATAAVAASLLEQPAVEGVEGRGRQTGELERAQLGHDVAFDVELVGRVGRGADRALDGRQPLPDQELLDVHAAGRHEGPLLNGGEHLVHRRLALPLRAKAALDGAAALLGLEQLAAALRAGHPWACARPRSASCNSGSVGRRPRRYRRCTPRSRRARRHGDEWSLSSAMPPSCGDHLVSSSVRPS